MSFPTPAYQSAVLANLAATGQSAQIPFYQQLFTAYNNAPGASRATPYNGTTYANAFEGAGRSNLDENLITGRVDWRLGGNDNMFAHVKYDHGVQPTVVDPISAAFNSLSDQPDYEGQMQETHTFSPNLINQFILLNGVVQRHIQKCKSHGGGSVDPLYAKFRRWLFHRAGRRDVRLSAG